MEVAVVDADPELDRKLDDLRHEVAEQGGVPLASPDGRRYGARFCIAAPDPAAAVDEGVEQFRRAANRAGLADSPVVNVEAPTLSELAVRNTAPNVPDLVDIAQVGEMMGADRALVTILVRSRGFPAPAAELHAGPVWTRASVVDFLRRSEPDCAQCGVVHADVAPDRVPGALVEQAEHYRRLLDDARSGDLRSRPAPGKWSALEYACHVRDVIEVQRERLQVALDTERPTLEPMGREEHFDLHGYNDEEPAAVAAQLVATAVRLADDLAGLDGAGQQRAGVQSWPEEAERTLEWVARHTLHEMKHHLRDIESLLAAARRPFPG